MEWTDFDTRVAAYAVVVDSRDRILLALWNEPTVPQWGMPGGGVELDESTAQAVVRELREETGYDVAVDGLLGVSSIVIPPARRFHPPSNRPLKGLRVIYRAHVVGGELANEVGGTTDEARWFPLDEVVGLHRVELVDIAIGLWRDAHD